LPTDPQSKFMLHIGDTDIFFGKGLNQLVFYQGAVDIFHFEFVGIRGFKFSVAAFFNIHGTYGESLFH